MIQNDPSFVTQALFKNSLSFFIQKAFSVISSGDKYMHNWHIDYISEHLEACLKGDIKRLIINVPPRNMKSICASVAFPAWVLGKSPSKKIIVCSYGSELAEKHSIDCRAVMQSPFYEETFPKTKIVRNKQAEYSTSHGGFRLATSIGGTLTGLGGDILIIDDPIKPSSALSDTLLQNVNQWYDNTLYSRLNSKSQGCIIIIMQRLHENDLVGHILEQEDWVHLKIPAITEVREEIKISPNLIKPYTIIREPGSALHPKRESLEQLQHMKNNILGSYNFAGQYQQEPAPIQGGMIKLDWFQRYDDLPAEKPIRVVQSWDTASKAQDVHDYSVCTTWHEYKNSWYLVDVYRKKLEFPELRKVVIEQANQKEVSAILIEDKGSGTQLIQDIKRQSRLPIKPMTPKGDKETRMLAHSPKIECGKVFIPRHANWLSDFEGEARKFPKSRHDDQIDSLSQALEYLDQRKTIFKIA